MSKTKKIGPTSRIIQLSGRVVAGAYYDSQQIRLSSMNRIRDILRKKNEGIDFDATEEKKEEKTYTKEYNDENIVGLIKKMFTEGKLTKEEASYLQGMIDMVRESHRIEDKYRGLMNAYVNSERVFTEFLTNVRGIGPVLSANLIKNFGNCEKFGTVAALWKYCGMHTVPTAYYCSQCKQNVPAEKVISKKVSSGHTHILCPVCGKDNLPAISGNAPRREKGKRLEYSTTCKALSWKIADCFIKSNSPVYRELYDTERVHQDKLTAQKAVNAPKNKMHAHLRAMRKMVKLFLLNYWEAARELHNLPRQQTYTERAFGKSQISWRQIVQANKDAPKRKRSKEEEVIEAPESIKKAVRRGRKTAAAA